MGTKYIIELEEKAYEQEKDPDTVYFYGPKLWRAKGFSTLVFDSYGISKLQEYVEPAVSFRKEEDLKKAMEEEYRRGQDDLFSSIQDAFFMSLQERVNCFGDASFENLIDSHDPSEIIQKYSSWKNEKDNKDIKEGDEVRLDGKRAVVTKALSDCLYVLTVEGVPFFTEYRSVEKTGRHIPIGDYLSEMFGPEDLPY